MSQREQDEVLKLKNSRQSKLTILSPAPSQVLPSLSEITGVGSPCNRVAVAIDGGEVRIATCDRTGCWSVPVEEALTPGVHSITARTVTNGRGCTAVTGFSIRGRTEYLPLPEILEPEDCGIVSGCRVNLIGTGTPGNRITAQIRPLYRAEVTVGANAIWKLSFDGPFTCGRHVASAMERDSGGNTSPEAWCEFWVV